MKIRKALNLFANLRPAYLYPQLAGACPLKEEISKAGFDMLIMRELTGGLYLVPPGIDDENSFHSSLLIVLLFVRRMVERQAAAALAVVAVIRLRDGRRRGDGRDLTDADGAVGEV